MPVRLDWLGTAPPPALVAALAARDVPVHLARATAQAPCVLASAAARRPRAPGAGAWIWAYEGRLDDAAATAAVLDGAYTGAAHEYAGQIAAAAGGTVFLDEIDDTPPALQVKLLRVLEDRVVSRLGENSWRQVDFRIIAATNRDLRALVEAGAFGADLYERLAIVTIALPPLRERLDDLPELAQRFVERFYAEEPEAGPRVRGVRADARRALAAYPWPGNVRELRNV